MSHFGHEPFPGPEEALLRQDAIDYIHIIRNHYSLLDQGTLTQKERKALTKRYFVIDDLANDIIPIQHHRMALVPLPRHDKVGNIALVYLRIPTPYYDRENKETVFEGEYERRETPQWNDIFIELLDEHDQQLEKYLLNSAGLTPYTKLQSEDSVETDIIRNYVDLDITGNLFIAVEGQTADSAPPKFTIHMLHDALRDYVPMLQDNS